MKVHADKAGYGELTTLIRLREKHPHLEHVIDLLDHFEHAGPNGLHLCLVMELMWSDISGFIGGQYNWPEIRTTVCKEVVKQVLKGLAILGELGIVHNG